MQTVTIIGVGLIGGSFGLALRKAGFRGKILGVSSPRTLDRALARGAIDEGMPLAGAAAQADLVYLSQPIAQILATLDALDPCIRPGALVTDAGSTKARIVDRARSAIRRGQFLGGHPMAGKEKRGVEQADPDLFAGRTYVLTPSDSSELDTPAAREFLHWIEAIGAVPLVLEPAGHDRVVSFTSHLPQLLSTALASTLAEKLDPGMLRAAGPGLADMTRLASSSYGIWGDILATNAAEIGLALDACIAQLVDQRAHLDSGEMRQAFETANEFAAKLRGR